MGITSFLIKTMWSKKYSHCQNPKCITPEAKHWAGGLCSVCYQAKHYKKNKSKRVSYFENYRATNRDKIKQINLVYNSTKRVQPKKTGIWSTGTKVQVNLGSYKLFGKIVKRKPSLPFHLLSIRLDSGKLCRDIPTNICIPIDETKRKKLKAT